MSPVRQPHFSQLMENRAFSEPLLLSATHGSGAIAVIRISGHTHYYMRSKPIVNELVAEHVSQGTVYVISLGIPGNHKNMPAEEYYRWEYHRFTNYSKVNLKC